MTNCTTPSPLSGPKGAFSAPICSFMATGCGKSLPGLQESVIKPQVLIVRVFSHRNKATLGVWSINQDTIGKSTFGSPNLDSVSKFAPL